MGFFKDMASENGEPSSKRFVGLVTYAVVLGCVIGLVVKDGGTSVVESLLQTLLITATSLLGISSVTSIWKGNKASATNIDGGEIYSKQQEKHKNHDED